MIKYVKHEQFGFDVMFVRVFDFIPGGDEGAEVRGGGEDESIDIVLLVVLYFFLFVEDGVGVLDLFDADDIWFSEYAFAFG